MDNLPFIVRGLEVQVTVTGDDDRIGTNTSKGGFQIALIETVLADVGLLPCR